MGRYRLLEQHYSEEDKLLEGDKELGEGMGTIVGDGTPHKWRDEKSKAAVAREKLRGDGLNPVDYLPLIIDSAVIGNG